MFQATQYEDTTRNIAVNEDSFLTWFVFTPSCMDRPKHAACLSCMPALKMVMHIRTQWWSSKLSTLTESVVSLSFPWVLELYTTFQNLSKSYESKPYPEDREYTEPFSQMMGTHILNSTRPWHSPYSTKISVLRFSCYQAIKTFLRRRWFQRVSTGGDFHHSAHLRWGIWHSRTNGQ